MFYQNAALVSLYVHQSTIPCLRFNSNHDVLDKHVWDIFFHHLSHQFGKSAAATMTAYYLWCLSHRIAWPIVFYLSWYGYSGKYKNSMHYDKNNINCLLVSQHITIAWYFCIICFYCRCLSLFKRQFTPALLVHRAARPDLVWVCHT